MLLIPFFLHSSNVEYNLDPNSDVSCTGSVSASSSTELKGKTLYGSGAVKAWLSAVVDNDFTHARTTAVGCLTHANCLFTISAPTLTADFERVNIGGLDN